MKRRYYVPVIALSVVFLIVSCGEEDTPIEQNVSEQDSGKYSVTLDAFSIGGGDATFITLRDEKSVSDLENGIISAKIRQEFNHSNFPLPDNAFVVTVVHPDKESWSHWIIVSENTPNPLFPGYRVYTFEDKITICSVQHTSVYLYLTIENHSLETLSMDDCNFSVVDLDEKAIYREYEPEKTAEILPVGILPGGQAQIRLGFTFGGQPRGEYKLFVRLIDEEKVLEIPIDEGRFDTEYGSFIWGESPWL